MLNYLKILLKLSSEYLKLILHFLNLSPAPKISWYKDGTLVYDADKGFVDGAADNFRISEGSMKLDILRVKKTDAGVYKCVAKNPFASDEKEGRLIVHRKFSLSVKI